MQLLQLLPRPTSTLPAKALHLEPEQWLEALPPEAKGEAAPPLPPRNVKVASLLPPRRRGRRWFVSRLQHEQGGGEARVRRLPPLQRREIEREQREPVCFPLGPTPAPPPKKTPR